MAVTKLFQGDIVLMPFPFTDLKGSKPRPAIVVSNKVVNIKEDVIFAAITSTLRNDEFSFKFNSQDLSHKLEEGEVRCHKLFTAKKGIVLKKISALKKERHQELMNKIKSYFDPDY